MKNYTDNKKFWNTVKPLFSNFNGGSQKITLIEDDKIISNDEDIARIFNNYFVESVKSLDLSENNAILNHTENLTDPVEIALHKFKCHPSIIEIKEKVLVESKFSFSKITVADIRKEIKNLDIKKAGTFSNIPAKQLKLVKEEIVGPLMQIWNHEIIDNQNFPSKLKFADISPIFKKLECILK